MKKFLTAAFWTVMIISLAGTFACRERSFGPPGSEPTATPINTPAPFGAVFDFESNLQGWVLGGDPGFTVASRVEGASVPGGSAQSGSYCAAVTCDFHSGAIAGEFEIDPSPADFRDGSTITAHVFVPATLPDAYSFQLFILGTAFAYHAAQYPVTSLTKGAWNTFTLDLAGIADADLSAVERVDVQLNSNGGADWAGPIYVDNVIFE